MNKIKGITMRFIKDENGQSIIEYALLAALLVIAIIAIIKTLGKSIGAKFQSVSDNLK